jgi:hypothetical protein
VNVRRTAWWRWLAIAGVNVASVAGCQFIAGLNGPFGTTGADAAASLDAGTPTCSPTESCGDPSLGCCIVHGDGSFTSTCVTSGCTQPDTYLYFCFGPGDCANGESCCAHTLFSPPKPPNTIYATVCSAGSCPTNYSTQICDPFHPSVCGDAGCLLEGSPPSGFPTYYYCGN